MKHELCVWGWGMVTCDHSATRGFTVNQVYLPSLNHYQHVPSPHPYPPVTYYKQTVALTPNSSSQPLNRLLVQPVTRMYTIMRPIFILLIYSFLLICVECYPTPSPCRSMRLVNFSKKINYDLFNHYYYEVLIVTSFICLTLCNIASTFIKNNKYITFDTCLDYLPSHLTAKHDWDILFWLFHKIIYVYLFNGHLLLPLSEDLQSMITQFAFHLLAFIIKIYVQTYFNFIFLCKILFPDLSPFIRLVSLWFFAMMLLLSSDIETQPGPRPSGFNVPVRGFSDSFFSFCNWNINTLSKNDFQRVSLLEAHNSMFNYDIIS